MFTAKFMVERREIQKMRKAVFVKFLLVVCAVFSLPGDLSAQEKTPPPIVSQEVSESDGIPVLIKHLPNWENVRKDATLTNNVNDLLKALGERPVFDLIYFAGGTEAVTAPYKEGKLLIIEYPSPQTSVEADNIFKERLVQIGQNPPIFYRRIGNYNAFVFDANDEATANVLLDQVKYEKDIQWLGTNPFLFQRAERAFVVQTADLFTSTFILIGLGIGFTLVAGLIAGIFYFYIREQKRSTMETFSDAGGMTRLNLDGLTPQSSPDRLLND
ncbi:MAG: hypothetical protein ACR2HT_00910 [Pyrinomonadaceae bacterium]